MNNQLFKVEKSISYGSLWGIMDGMKHQCIYTPLVDGRSIEAYTNEMAADLFGRADVVYTFLIQAPTPQVAKTRVESALAFIMEEGPAEEEEDYCFDEEEGSLEWKGETYV